MGIVWASMPVASPFQYRSGYVHTLLHCPRKCGPARHLVQMTILSSPTSWKLISCLLERPKPMNKKYIFRTGYPPSLKVSLGAALILLLALGIVAVLVKPVGGLIADAPFPIPTCTGSPSYTPQISQTDLVVEWNKYENRRFGYSVRYPPEGKVKVAKLGDPITENNKLVFILIGSRGWVYIERFDNPEKLSARSWVERFIIDGERNTKRQEGSERWIVSCQEVITNDIKGIQLIRYGIDKKLQSVFLARDSHIFEISFPVADNPNDPNSKSNYEIYNGILSSFDFIETQTEEISIAGFSDNDILADRGSFSVIDVPSFSQKDKRWGGQQLGNCVGIFVRDAGCAITSAAMLWKYQGDDTDPGKLNTWLTNHNGYLNGCDLIWSRVGMNYVPGADWDTINQQLNYKLPVMVEVRSSSGSMHFVVVKGREGNTYYINDPLDGSTNRSLAYYNNTIYSVETGPYY